MDVINRNEVTAFMTKDTSTIREILAPRNSSIERQSLAEATLPPGAMTQAHYHPNTEEIYHILSGGALMRIEGDERSVVPGDGIAIPAGSPHQIPQHRRCRSSVPLLLRSGIRRRGYGPLRVPFQSLRLVRQHLELEHSSSRMNERAIGQIAPIAQSQFSSYPWLPVVDFETTNPSVNSRMLCH